MLLKHQPFGSSLGGAVVRGAVVGLVVAVMVVRRGECRGRKREHAAEEEKLLHRYKEWHEWGFDGHRNLIKNQGSYAANGLL
jgi:hypothetical protein